MKVNGRIGIASMLLLVLVALAATVSAIDLQITKTEINGVEVFPDDFVNLDLEKGQEVEVEVTFVSLDDLDDVEVRAIILSSEDDVEEVLPLFDTKEDTQYRKTLRLELPSEIDQDEYRLLVIISDRDGDELTEAYNLFVNSERHNLAIEDVILQPFGKVTAGDYLLAKVRVENFGQRDERNVRVVVSIPELGAQATSYINEIEFDDQADTEELLLRIPTCAEEKQYRLNVLVEYNDGREHVTQEQTVFVQANPDCSTQAANAESAVVVIRQDGGSEVPDVQVQDAPSNTRTALEVVLLVLVVLLVVIGLLIGFMKLRSDE